jgi:uncharacterized protein YdeI (YjbR/CyaY-like superfamily)
LLARCIDPAAQFTQVTALDIEPGMSGASVRSSNKVETGAEVEVVLAPEGPQAGMLAPDILAALDSEPEARAFFESLATFYRNGYLRWIEGAKRPETRSARIAEMRALLKAGKKQR